MAVFFLEMEGTVVQSMKLDKYHF